MPPKKPRNNHIHIPANPNRIKAEEIKERHRKRKEAGKPQEITNEVLYDMLIDIIEKQELLEQKFKQTNHSPVLR